MKRSTVPMVGMQAGRKLDALVAEKVVGWRCCSVFDFINPRGFPPDGGAEREIPFYSTEIAAAWEAVEKVKQLPEKPVVLIQNALMPGQWICRIYWPLITRFDDCVGFSAPHAICLASLRAVGVELTSP